MKIDFYLLIGVNGGVELRKTLPRQQRIDRVAVPLSITISNAWFRQQPIPTIDIVVPDAAVLPLPMVATEPLEDETE